jgi:hypothetical protein
MDQFQGPALIVYNNAAFSEADKENILNLGRSMKKDDPFTVGRFGLGFNCVYHICGKICLYTKRDQIVHNVLQIRHCY